MKHALRLTLSLLALGAATSVLIAWAFFAAVDTSATARKKWTTRQTISIYLSPTVAVTWFTHTRLGVTFATSGFYSKLDIPERVSIERAMSSTGLQRLHPSVARFLDGEVAIAEQYWKDTPRGGSKSRSPSHDVHMYGLPFRCVARRMDLATPIDAHSSLLPTTPIWRGLALNAAFCAVLWSIPLAAAPALIRWRRSRRGGCPDCGYDVSGLATCPECGTPVAESTA